jgi:hypothetical protein
MMIRKPSGIMRQPHGGETATPKLSKTSIAATIERVAKVDGMVTPWMIVIGPLFWLQPSR